ncbi:hypothetical protein DL93DRAFT_2092370 [Clavulina sp. PMI_390]|nr:hypothetical protein DL93DRAFT_2092370 [Clavulina sp. PMI_390]
MLQSIGIPYADSGSGIGTSTGLGTTSLTKKNAYSTLPEGSVCRFASEKAKRSMMKEVASDVPSEAKTANSSASSDDSHIAGGSCTVAGSSKSRISDPLILQLTVALSSTLVVVEDDDEALIDYDCDLDD